MSDEEVVKRIPVTLKEFQGVTKTMARECPLTWKAISSKRYLLPHYRQADYFSQELLDTIMGIFLITYYNGDYGRQPDQVIRAMYRVAVMSLLENRPLWFLEKELGEKLLVTRFPGDLSTDEVHWRRKVMRIMLPRGLVTISRPQWERPRSLMYVDIGRADQNDPVHLERFHELELRGYGAKRGMLKSETVPMPLFDRDGIVITGQLENLNGALGENYALIRPFAMGMKLSAIQEGEPWEDTAMCDDKDNTFLARMENLAVNVLLFMGSIPLEYEPQEGKPIRKLEVLKDRIIPELLAAKFVGKSQYRPSQKPHYHIAHDTGRRLPKHWRGGHWKRQVYGPGGEGRKLIWIEPYETLGPQPEKQEEPENGKDL